MPPTAFASNIMPTRGDDNIMKSRFFHAGLAAALVVGTGLMLTVSVKSQTGAQASSVSTPRMPDGKPDLTGLWNGDRPTEFAPVASRLEVSEGNIITRLGASRRCGPTQFRCHENTNQNNDGEFTGRTDPNRPLYKPEYWDKVQELDYNTNFADPMFKCQPIGVPRMGPPTKIVQTANEVIFFFAGGVGAEHDYRLIPTDGRAHDPLAFPTYYGDAVGHWEGETLVVDIVSFNDITWLGPRGGYFHSHELHVTERLRREGNILHYQATVEDPKVLLEPWVQNARQVRLTTDPTATIDEGRPCHDYESGEIIVYRIRH